ncbi:MAG: hypothetical protein ACK5CL_00245 [Sphingomonadales bacterium]|jgi:hypothetical protein
MKHITKLFFLSAMALMMASSCKKDDKNDNNTPAPTANAGITSASLNGKSWTSGKTGTTIGLDSIPGCEAYLNGDTLIFIATNYADTSIVLAQLVLTSGRTGTYTGTSSPSGFMIYLPSPDQNLIFTSFFLYTTSYSFTINKWDSSKQLFSGTFNFNMVSNTGGQGYNMTNGKFDDVNYFLD